MRVRRRGLLLSLLLFPFLVACSRQSTLTPDTLKAARDQWRGSAPPIYTLTVEMQGDRVEASRYDVSVQSGVVESLRRNGEVVLPGRGQDYSMEGLFKVLEQELELASKPALLGAPGGYSAYLMASFDPKTGGLVSYKRTVGGTTNSVEIKVLAFEAQAVKP